MAYCPPDRARVKARAADLRAGFETAGAAVVEAPVLLSAEALLDLYGEDLRARAYTTSDALRGEQMLRPDFTVPVVQMHMAGGAEPARYTYSGEVFRRQEEDEARANEYLQVGFEIFDGSDTEAADAEVFARMRDAVEPLREKVGLRATTGDIGILRAAVEGLSTSGARKRALRRHLWRPARFKQLLDRFAGRTPFPPSRLALLEKSDPFAEAGPEIGLRDRAEIESRLEALRADAAETPIPAAEIELIEGILQVRETLPNALEHLRDIAVDLPAISDAVDRLKRRAAALDRHGVNVEALEFEASYGRTHMEYYDGFVFGFVVAGRPDLPAIASGGRYDALTRELGRGAGKPEGIPAVGGILRPGLMVELEDAA
ncbi:ATP phosphoribosyltransferase regulatory subunit [Pseudooceanicola marinus]|uniref:ATP phosphoribosyltransferase regulatory subunit n=1 Tax=Pseudooceanicola marinus TaxID=396013 RepID=UPI001CD3880C|nr:ATP phosphoribosyltransferase regulatory subunit [Pseudooceanicola marinus]MCA1334990.1 ATP phosphoribosyltransferase regulatory subunit [Pseudooceanicola marinus]